MKARRARRTLTVIVPVHAHARMNPGDAVLVEGPEPELVGRVAKEILEGDGGHLRRLVLAPVLQWILLAALHQVL